MGNVSPNARQKSLVSSASSCEIPKTGKRPLQSCRSSDEHIVIAAPRDVRQGEPCRLSQPPLDAVAHHRFAKLLGDEALELRLGVLVDGMGLQADGFGIGEALLEGGAVAGVDVLRQGAGAGLRGTGDLGWCQNA